jgi:hypothetical protein
MALLLFLVVGLILVVGGHMPLSQRKEVRGTTARLIGLVFLLLPVLWYGVGLLAFGLLSTLDMTESMADVWASVIGYAVIFSILLLLAANLKRWSTPRQRVAAASQKADFNALAEGDRGTTDLSFLNKEEQATAKEPRQGPMPHEPLTRPER